MSVKSLAMGAAGYTEPPTYIEDVFSTYLYTGTTNSTSFNNGVNLSGKGGMVWIKNRSDTGGSLGAYHRIFDTVNDTQNCLYSNATDALTYAPGSLTAFNNNGFTIGTASTTNAASNAYASWTFRKAPKFFDVVTYTGDGAASKTISHSLGVAPGMMIVKRTDSAFEWGVYHKDTGSSKYLVLNTTAAAASSTVPWNATDPTASSFTVGMTLNINGATYVAYLFAHDTAADGVIQCGSFTGPNQTVTLGWEPQFILYKDTAAAGTSWQIIDNMRGMSLTDSARLFPNSSGSELTGSQWITPTPTGFITGASFAANTFIYMAIRRGPMRTPTDATKVFSVSTVAVGSSAQRFTGNFFDAAVHRNLSSTTNDWRWSDKLRGIGNVGGTGQYLASNSTNAESTLTDSTTNNTSALGVGGFENAIRSYCYTGQGGIQYGFRRAPGFFDIVCWEGDGTYERNIPHNLKVVPELVIVKNRKLADNWYVNGPYTNWSLGYPCMFLNLNSAAVGNTNTGIKNVTSTTFEVRHPNTNSNSATRDYVAYLFASCPGVSKVGSYTGNGTSQTINCGFAAGARFFLVKATSTTGNWWVYDTARGVVAAADPTLALNTTSAEVTSADAVDPDATGIIVNQEATCSINATGVSYIYLAIA